MSALRREQIEQIKKIRAEGGFVELHKDIVAELCNRALQALDQEEDPPGYGMLVKRDRENREHIAALRTQLNAEVEGSRRQYERAKKAEVETVLRQEQLDMARGQRDEARQEAARLREWMEATALSLRTSATLHREEGPRADSKMVEAVRLGKAEELEKTSDLIERQISAALQSAPPASEAKRCSKCGGIFYVHPCLECESATDPAPADRTHYLKTDPDVFHSVKRGHKTFEIRYEDRDYRVGDALLLRETHYTGEEMRNGKPLEYTGEECTVEVTHILRGPVYGLADGWVILSIKRPATDPAPADRPEPTGEALARLFHEIYERRALDYGYITREDTRQFEPTSTNGRLMIATCEEVRQHLQAGVPSETFKRIRHERDCYLAVLKGAEFAQLHVLPSQGVEFSRKLGEESARRTRALADSAPADRPQQGDAIDGGNPLAGPDPLCPGCGDDPYSCKCSEDRPEPSEALKPCPFCGGEAVIQGPLPDDGHGNEGAYAVACTSCMASSKLLFPLKSAVHESLAEAWNQRLSQPVLADYLRPDYPLRCDECGRAHILDTSIPSHIWNRIARPEEVLCTVCIDMRLVQHGLTAEAEFYYSGAGLKSRLYGEGVPYGEQHLQAGVPRLPAPLTPDHPEAISEDFRRGWNECRRCMESNMNALAAHDSGDSQPVPAVPERIRSLPQRIRAMAPLDSTEDMMLVGERRGYMRAAAMAERALAQAPAESEGGQDDG